MSFPMAVKPATIWARSSGVRRPAFSKAAEWAMEPAMSCRHKRQSKLMD